MPFAAWQGADHCTAGATPGARALMKWILAAYPAASSAGIFNCRPVRGSSEKSAHAEGRALDVHFPGKANPAGTKLVQRLRPDAARLGIQAIIWSRTIWSAKSPGPAGRPYPGVNPHYDHAHIELTRKAGARLTLATIRHVLDVPKAGGLDLRRGDHGPAVVALQKALGVTADGVFGPRTEAAVNRFKRSRQLPLDGVAGEAVRKALKQL